MGEDAWLIDLASTNGVRRSGARSGAEVLRDHDRISLGAHMVLGWSRTLHARA